MSDEWTISALKEYFDQRFIASERALDAAKHELEHRLARMNEFRDQIQDERVNYLTKGEYDQRNQSLESKVGALDEKTSVRVLAIERWQSRIVGALAFVIFITPILAGLITWLVTQQKVP